MKHTICKRLFSLLLTLAMLFTLAPVALADGEGDGDEGEATTYTLKSVTLTPSTVPSLKVGAIQELTAKITVEAKTGDETKTEEFTSDTPAENLPEGLDIKWTVTEGRENEVSITKNEAYPLKATAKARAIAPTNANPKAVYVTVTATLPNGNGKATCDITVIPAEDPGIKLSASKIELAPNETKQLIATITPETASQDVTWDSKDISVATVAAGVPTTSATVTAVAAGETKVTASANGLQAECVVQVQGIVLAEEELTLRVGKNQRLDYTIYGDKIKDKGVTWTSSDKNIVDVSQGYLYPKSVGKATITVSVNGYSEYKDSVEIIVEKATAEVIHASASTGSPLALSSLLSQLKAQSTNVLKKSLSYVSALSVPTSQGTLYYNYVSEGNTGDGVATSGNYYVNPGNGQNGLSNITFVPKSDFEGTAVISYTGYASGTEFFQGTIEVSIDAPNDVTYASSNGNVVQFDASDFALVCRQQTGGDLSYVTFSIPDESWGTLYEGYLSPSYPGNPVSVNTKYKYSGSPNLGEVYFLPTPGTSGTVTIAYTGYNVTGTSFRGRVTIKLTAAAASGDITYSIGQGGKVNFDDRDFNDLSRSLTGYNLDRVRFTLPPSSQGILYYNYTSSGNYSSLVTEDRDYYRSSSLYLDNITFVANEKYAGTVSIPFTAWDTQGNRFSGEVGIAVSAQGSGAVRYTTYRGGTVTFDDSDFNNLSLDVTGSSLNYVRFTLPASSKGTLYYDYTSAGNYGSKVTESRNYYRSSSPRLDDVTFVASSSFTGTVTIDFTGWNTKGESFSGTVEIDVGTTQNPLSYTVAGGSVLTFQDADFDDYCRMMTGDSLNYVRFTLPSSSQGTLYYDYTSSTNYGSKVTASRNYYRSSSPYLDRVSFVPSSYAGTVSLDFTGWSTEGEQFTGTVTITVTQKQAGIITYYTSYDPVTFQAADFTAVCSQQGYGTLKSVQFTGADSVYGGRLYYRYSGIHSASSQVRSTALYYPSSTPSISEVAFVPWVGFSGTISLTYTAATSTGGTYQGTVRIQVAPNTTSGYFTDMGSAGWAAAAVDFLHKNGVVSGTGGSSYSPNAAITRGNFLVMLNQAFQFPGTGTQNFSDVPADAYYAQAIGKAHALGVVSGYPDGTFRPNDPITREAAAAMLYQAMVSTGWSIGWANESVLYSYSDWQSISSYAREPMAVLVKNGLFSGDNQDRLRPTQTMTRAEMAVVLARALTL